MTPEKAHQIAAEFICEGMQYGDPIPKLAQLFVTYCTPAAGRVRDDKGVERKVLGTLPITADGCVAGFPPGYGSLWAKGQHVSIDRFDPVCMWYDGRTRMIFLRATGLHGGIEFDGRPIGEFFSTEEAARAACGQEKKA